MILPFVECHLFELNTLGISLSSLHELSKRQRTIRKRFISENKGTSSQINCLSSSNFISQPHLSPSPSSASASVSTADFTYSSADCINSQMPVSLTDLSFVEITLNNLEVQTRNNTGIDQSDASKRGVTQTGTDNTSFFEAFPHSTQFSTSDESSSRYPSASSCSRNKSDLSDTSDLFSLIKYVLEFPKAVKTGATIKTALELDHSPCCFGECVDPFYRSHEKALGCGQKWSGGESKDTTPFPLIERENENEKEDWKDYANKRKKRYEDATGESTTFGSFVQPSGCMCFNSLKTLYVFGVSHTILKKASSMMEESFEPSSNSRSSLKSSSRFAALNKGTNEDSSKQFQSCYTPSTLVLSQPDYIAQLGFPPQVRAFALVCLYFQEQLADQQVRCSNIFENENSNSSAFIPEDIPLTTAAVSSSSLFTTLVKHEIHHIIGIISGYTFVNYRHCLSVLSLLDEVFESFDSEIVGGVNTSCDASKKDERTRPKRKLSNTAASQHDDTKDESLSLLHQFSHSNKEIDYVLTQSGRMSDEDKQFSEDEHGIKKYKQGIDSQLDKSECSYLENKQILTFDPVKIMLLHNLPFLVLLIHLQTLIGVCVLHPPFVVLIIALWHHYLLSPSSSPSFAQPSSFSARSTGPSDSSFSSKRKTEDERNHNATRIGLGLFLHYLSTHKRERSETLLSMLQSDRKQRQRQQKQFQIRSATSNIPKLLTPKPSKTRLSNASSIESSFVSNTLQAKTPQLLSPASSCTPPTIDSSPKRNSHSQYNQCTFSEYTVD
eukprot:MONOS_8653.1-p1 / transcript=MONOS_8653.1 / gene=MONOS_8653 / organism=Monocercomonoides_exilis_PA203 / gene_product=unspecified product / transcript_product=unspecified product / location=Mono_scaffold00331:56724-59257(-) / protein_length=779 / sequence_SO=supercontig / SO=protein_coding / is_pseudo=false